MDGTGYYRGARGRELPLGARIIAVANRLDELTHDAAGVPALSLADALQVLGAEAGSMLDPEIVDVVRGSLGGKTVPAAPHAWPAGLTDREVEVLRLASKGMTRRDVGEALGISENTVRHHLEHIYGKTGTTTRVGATLFAMENDLLIEADGTIVRCGVPRAATQSSHRIEHRERGVSHATVYGCSREG